MDLPGYGHAVASAFDKKQWKEMTRDYLGGSRVILSRCCVLVDCSRGICEEDRKLLRFLSKVNTPWQVILTKGDLLTAEELGQSMAAVFEDIKDFKGVVEENKVLPVSASTGAGIQSLWRELRKAAELSSKPAPLGSVKEHIKADVVKRSVNALR